VDAWESISELEVWAEAPETTPEVRRPKIAQRFSAGIKLESGTSPGGTTDVLTHRL